MGLNDVKGFPFFVLIVNIYLIQWTQKHKWDEWKNDIFPFTVFSFFVILGAQDVELDLNT